MQDPVLANQISAKAIDGLAGSTSATASPDVLTSSSARASLPGPTRAALTGPSLPDPHLSDYPTPGDIYGTHHSSSNGTNHLAAALNGNSGSSALRSSYLAPQSNRDRDLLGANSVTTANSGTGGASTLGLGLGGLPDFPSLHSGRQVPSSSSSSTTTPASDRTLYDLSYYEYQPSKPTTSAASNGNSPVFYHQPIPSSLDTIGRKRNEPEGLNHYPLPSSITTTTVPTSSTNLPASRPSYGESSILLSLGRRGQSQEEFERELRESERIALEVLCSQRTKSTTATNLTRL